MEIPAVPKENEEGKETGEHPGSNRPSATVTFSRHRHRHCRRCHRRRRRRRHHRRRRRPVALVEQVRRLCRPATGNHWARGLGRAPCHRSPQGCQSYLVHQNHPSLPSCLGSRMGIQRLELVPYLASPQSLCPQLWSVGRV